MHDGANRSLRHRGCVRGLIEGLRAVAAPTGE